MRGKKGGAFLGVIVFIIIFISAMQVVEPMQDMIVDSRDDLSCSSADSISDGTKVLCLIVDSTLPYYIVAMISLALSFISWRLLR